MIVFIMMGTSCGDPHGGHGYQVGQQLEMKCLNRSKQWGDGPFCINTGKPMTFQFGVDSFQNCAWHIKDAEDYKFIVSLAKQEESWRCRIKMVPEHDFYVPFEIPIWGVVEADHMHVDNHLNIIFHAMHGSIIGVAAYPVRDRFAFAKESAILMLHGPVKWFNGANFASLSSNAFTESMQQASFPYFAVFLWCIITVIASFLSGTAIYRYMLKPRLISKYIKKD